MNSERKSKFTFAKNRIVYLLENEISWSSGSKNRRQLKLKMAAAMDIDDEAAVSGADRLGNRKRFEVKKVKISMQYVYDINIDTHCINLKFSTLWIGVQDQSTYQWPTMAAEDNDMTEFDWWQGRLSLSTGGASAPWPFFLGGGNIFQQEFGIKPSYFSIILQSNETINVGHSIWNRPQPSKLHENLT